MKIYILFFLVVLVSGCTTLGARDSIVTLPSGEEYRILCQSDGKLDYTAGGVQISVDNRGRPGILEQMFGALVLSLPGGAEELTD